MLVEWLPSIPLYGWMLSLAVMLLVYTYMSTSPWRHIPPGPPSFPLIGSIPFLGGDMREVFARMAARYGNVFSVRIGPQLVVVLNGYETIKKTLLKTPRIYDGRSDIFKDLDNCAGIISSDGELWKTMRSFSQHTMRNFGLGTRSMEQLILDEIQHLVNELQHLCDTPHNVDKVIRKAVANIIAVIIFGKRYEYEDPVYNSFLSYSHRLAELLGANNPALTFKVLRWIPGDPFRYHELKSAVVMWNKKWAEEIKLRQDKLESGEDAEDLISLFLKQIPQWSTVGDQQFFEEHLIHVIGDMFGAGTDTTSNTLLWAILYMILNPNIQAKLHREVERVIGADREPSMKDKVNMPFMESFISEVQRISDIAPLAIPHSTLEATTLEGYTIPKRTMIIPNLHSVHHDPELWPQPDQFQPERFLDNDGKYRKHEEFIPYSIGKRSCLGENLAKMELFLFLTSVLQKFTFSVAPGQGDPSTEGVLGITHHPKDFDVLISNRSSEL